MSQIYGTPEYEKLESEPSILIEITRKVFDNTNLKDLWYIYYLTPTVTECKPIISQVF